MRWTLPIVLISGVPATVASHHTGEAVVAHSTGFIVRQAVVRDADATGDLVRCNAGEQLFTTSWVFSFLDGICDEGEGKGLPKCDGLFTGLQEECSNADEVLAAGQILSVASRGKFRICFDPDEDSDCTGSERDLKDDDVVIIAKGKTRTQARQDVREGPISANTETTVKKLRGFKFLRKWRKLRFTRHQVLDVTTQPDPDEDNCNDDNADLPIVDCGTAATWVRASDKKVDDHHKSKRHDHHKKHKKKKWSRSRDHSHSPKHSGSHGRRH